MINSFNKNFNYKYLDNKEYFLSVNKLLIDFSENNFPIFKKGGSIYIKKKNRGSFTKYCNGKVTEECIKRGKNSPDAKIRKKAIFADNSRKWKHQIGGIINNKFKDYGI